MKQHVFSRRIFFTAAALMVPTVISGGLARPAAAADSHSQDVLSGELRITGQDVPELASFDKVMQKHMVGLNIPGAALAVAKDGKLLLARGYALASSPEDIQPTSLFRIASVSKPITGVTVTKLAQDGKLNLTTPILSLLKLESPKDRSATADLKRVTVVHLLQHLGGWDRTKAFDPMFYDAQIASALQVKLPVGQSDIAKFMSGQPLQHLPGTTYAYSNFGYMLLGQIIEQVSGQSYEDYV